MGPQVESKVMLIPFDKLFREYDVRPVGILHLGANEGQEARTYNEHAGCCPVIWVEALPDVCRKLRQHIIHYPEQLALCACVSDRTGDVVRFHVANNDGQSSSFLDFGTHAQEHPTVKFTKDIVMRTIRVDELLKAHDVEPTVDGWFLNADLQGAELLALKGMGDLLRLFRWAYIEVNDKELYKGCALTPEVDSYLAQYGLKPVETKMTGAGWGDRFYVRETK